MSDITELEKTNETTKNVDNSVVDLKVKKPRQNLQRRRITQLPLARVRAIMKISPGQVQNISKDGIYLVSKATELFLQYLGEKIEVDRNQKVDYRQLSRLVQTDKPLEFLQKCLPPKITYKQYKEMMEKQEKESELVSWDSDMSISDCVFEYSSQDSEDSNHQSN